MNHLFLLIAILIGASSILEAQPRITAIGNAADYSTPLAPGSLATIIGTGLAASAAQPGALPFPVSFNNVSVSVNGRTAPLTYISPAQINFQIPYSTAVGSATLSVSFSGQSSNILRFPVVASAPGIFQYGENRAVAQNQDYSVNSSDNPANGGASIVVYLTGIGLTNPVVADGTAAPSSPLAYPTGAVSANLEGADAAVLFLGLTPGSVGLAQANLRVPVIPSGDYRLTITVGGVPARTALVSVKSPPGTPPPGLPAGANCVSGLVDLVSYSRETLISEVAGEVGIGGTLLCSKCDFKAPVHPEIVERMKKAQAAGLPVDACFDGLGNINLMRLRQR